MKARNVTVYKSSPSGNVVDYAGKFIGWGLDFDELRDGVGQFTVGVIEKGSGSVELVPVNRFMFDDATPAEV